MNDTDSSKPANFWTALPHVIRYTLMGIAAIIAALGGSYVFDRFFGEPANDALPQSATLVETVQQTEQVSEPETPPEPQYDIGGSWRTADKNFNTYEFRQKGGTLEISIWNSSGEVLYRGEGDLKEDKVTGKLESASRRAGLSLTVTEKGRLLSGSLHSSTKSARSSSSTTKVDLRRVSDF